MFDAGKIVGFLSNYKVMLAILTIITILTALAFTGVSFRVGNEVVDIDTTANVQYSTGVNLSFYPHDNFDHSRSVDYPHLNIQNMEDI